MFSPDDHAANENLKEHAQQRLGLLTSSQAKVIMHGSLRGWHSLSKKMWTETEEQFTRPLTAATEYGHAHEAEGAAKFWERNPWVHDMFGDTFYTRSVDGVPFGSSPDRVLYPRDPCASMCGLEIKSPVGEKKFASHSLKAHWDQCQHGLLVTGFAAWFLLVHLGDRTASWDWIRPDPAWQAQYLKRAAAFWKFHNTGEQP